MRAAIISSMFFVGILGTDEGPWFAAIASIYMGNFLKSLLFGDLGKIRSAKFAAGGVLLTTVLAGHAVRYAPLLPGPEWVANAAACAAVFVSSVLVSGYFSLAEEVDRAAEEASE